MTNSSSFPTGDFREWSIPAVRLFQGVVYSDDTKVWNILLRHKSPLESYFSRLGLLLVVDEPEGYAFLRQLEEDELPEGWESLPKLMRRSSLGYDPTLLAVLLRDELRRFEDEDIHNARCVVEVDNLLGQWKMFFPTERDDVQHRNSLMPAMHKLEELGFVKKFSDSADAWEIRPILKARLPVAELERLKEAMVSAAMQKGVRNREGEPNE